MLVIICTLYSIDILSDDENEKKNRLTPLQIICLLYSSESDRKFYT